MLAFHEIHKISDPLFVKLYSLYISSFPDSERRSWEGLEHELLYEKSFHPNVLLKDNEFAGFLNYWTFDEFCYIEHFAVNANLRNQHIGSETMEIFMKQALLPIILEVEMPNNPTAARRIHFYERLGFVTLNKEYAQPPYDDEAGAFQPMLLMTNQYDFSNSNFETIKETIYDRVYHHKINS